MTNEKYYNIYIIVKKFINISWKFLEIMSDVKYIKRDLYILESIQEKFLIDRNFNYLH